MELKYLKTETIIIIKRNFKGTCLYNFYYQVSAFIYGLFS